MPHAGKPDDVVKYLTPLYLPDFQDYLKISTSFLYKDTYSYFHRLEVDLSGTPYSYFNIVEEAYGFSALDLCRLLPLQVRPQGMSQKCKQLPDGECQPVDSSDIALQLEISFQEQNNADNLVKVINKFVHKLNHDDLKLCIERLLFSINITTICHLKAQIVLAENNRIIGHVKSEYFFHCDDSEICLYIDSEVDQDHSIGLELAELILTKVCQYSKCHLSSENRNHLTRFIGRYLNSIASKKMRLLEDLDIEGTIPSGSGLDLKELGVEIPQLHLHRLDQDPDNIFKPMEYVGYEIMDNKIIVAQVAYLVPLKEESLFYKKYRIHVSMHDEVGREVSVLDMYKFLVGHKKPKVTSTGIHADTGALVPRDDGDEVLKLRASMRQSTSVEKKKNICDQLKEIWKLSPELKRRALKRLYLKYHPDKNFDNPQEYEILFLFLKTQIAHLDKGEPLDDPDVQFSNDSREQAHSSQSFSRNFDFDNWNATASKHHRGERSARSGAAHSNPFESEFNKSNPAEGRRWVRQAETDFGVLQSNLKQASSNRGYAHVCFLAHQVVEKALKGGIYALCGMDGRNLVDYNLSRNALALQTVKPAEAFSLVQHSSPLESYYLNTRYPNQWEGYTDIPSDHYKQEDAESAKVHAEEVLRIVNSIMP